MSKNNPLDEAVALPQYAESLGPPSASRLAPSALNEAPSALNEAPTLVHHETRTKPLVDTQSAKHDAQEIELPHDPILHHLTPEQRDYVLHRYSGLAPRKAVEAMGVEGKMAINKMALRLEKTPRCALALKELMRANLQEAHITRQDVLNGYMDAVRAAANSTELTLAWSKIAKLLGLDAPTKLQVEHGVNDQTMEKLKELSTDKLLKALGKDHHRILEGFTQDLIEDGEFEEIKAPALPKGPSRAG